MPKLICIHGNNQEDIFPVKDGENTVGRGHTCDVRLFDRTCSRTHCILVKKGTVVSVEDAGSRHGTLLNGKKVESRTRVQIGDRIQIGRTILRLDEGDATDADRIATDLQHQFKTQDITERLMGAELDIVKPRKHHTHKKRGLFGKH